MKILFVCRFMPHAQARDSGRLDTYNHINDLAAEHEVSLVAFVPPSETQFVAGMRQLCKRVEVLPYNNEALFGRLRRLAMRQLYTKVYGRVWNRSFAALIDRMLAEEQYDVAVLDGVMGLYGKKIQAKGVSILLDEVDLFAAVAYQYYRKEQSRLTRLHLWQDWLRTMSLETSFWRHFDGVLVRSEKDRLQIQEMEPDLPIGLAPIWFEGLGELREIAVQRPVGNKILYMGSMGLAPNIEAVYYFADEIFPVIRRQVPDAEFIIVGSRPHSSVIALGERPGIVVTGEVDELAPYYEMSALNVVPLLVGGGIICKTLNGLAAARPTVSTGLGNSGTTAADGVDLLIRERPDQFAAAVIDLLEDDAAWQRYAEAGRRFILENYSWKRDMRTFELFLRQFSANTPSNPPQNG